MSVITAMTRFGYLVVLAILIAIGAIGSGAWWYLHRPVPQESKSITATTTPACALGDCPFEITAADSGRTFTYALTSRFSVTLPEATYPHDELSCVPSNVIGYVSNGSTPPPYATTSAYTVRYEGTASGTCMLTDRDFTATIVIAAASPATSTGTTAVSTGRLIGTMTIGPICPVERADNPCLPTPEMFAAHPVTVYTKDRANVVATLTPDAHGAFSAPLPPGTYVVDTPHTSTPPTVRGVPKTITITAGGDTAVSIDIDTGIR